MYFCPSLKGNTSTKFPGNLRRIPGQFRDMHVTHQTYLERAFRVVVIWGFGRGRLYYVVAKTLLLKAV